MLLVAWHPLLQMLGLVHRCSSSLCRLLGILRHNAWRSDCCLASCRFSAVIEDDTITHMNVEPDGSGLSCSLASVVLEQLQKS